MVTRVDLVGKMRFGSLYAVKEIKLERIPEAWRARDSDSCTKLHCILIIEFSESRGALQASVILSSFLYYC